MERYGSIRPSVRASRHNPTTQRSLTRSRVAEVQHHPDAIALLVTGIYRTRDESVPVWRSIESPSFARWFGPLAGRMNGRLLIAGGRGRPLGDIAHHAMTPEEIGTKVGIPDLRGERHVFVAEAFYNRHNVLIMVSEQKARRFGRRIRVAAS